MTAPAPPLFSVRLVAGWLAAAALTSVVSLSLLVHGDGAGAKPDEVGPTIYSRSALGYAALYHTLQQLGIPVAENTAERVPAGAALVVVAEPSRDKAVLAHVRDVLARANAVLLVLPKRSGKPDAEHPGTIGRDALLPLADAQQVLALADESAAVERYPRASGWTTHAPLAGTPSTRGVQLVHGLVPLVEAPEGMLVGEIRRGERRIVVVSDPDVLENHGLARGDDAVLATALIASLRGGGSGRVLFDEVPHGYVSRALGIARLLFTFPFVLVTAQIALAAGLLAWSGASRFGAPRAREPALALGKRSLIDGGARLLAFAGKLPYVDRKSVV